MRKLLASVVISGVLCLTGCSSPIRSEEKCPNNLDVPFTADMNFTMDKLTADGTLKRLSDGEWEVEFQSPNTLSGVCLKFSSGTVTASYKGLSFSVPRSALPAKAMLSELIEAVDTNARSEELCGTSADGMLEITGDLESGAYTLTVDDKGQLAAFSMPNNRLRITFDELTVMN